MRLLRTLLLLVLACNASLFAQSSVPSQSQHSTAQTNVSPDTSDGATDAAITHYSLPPDKLAKARALYLTRTTLGLVGMLWSLVVLVGVLRWKVGPNLRDWAESVTRRRFVQAFLFVPALLFLLAVLDLPFSVYGHSIGLKYGLSVQRWRSWFWDWTKGELLSYIVAALVIWLLFAIIRRSPKRWWFYFWLATLPITLFGIFIVPVVVDPLFNKFEPLQKTDPALVSQIERVVHRGGLSIPESRMYEMKASEKVTTYNAYVTGLGATKRVVVWDNTARELTTSETLFIFGHEMGHYVLNHIWKGLAFSMALTFIVFYIGYRILIVAVHRWGTRLEIRGLGDWGALPLMLLVVSVLSFLIMPATNAFSRHLEHQADIYGLEVVHGLIPHSSETAALTFEKLGEKSLDYPDANRFLVFWFYSHPDISSRLQFALDYRPWDNDEPDKYVKQAATSAIGLRE